ncbi:MAG: hypothetical protein Q8P41_14130 [Pseudomonadota bacterium]|nr:hypothetical protein [Pseudomonadota bacterium]
MRGTRGPWWIGALLFATMMALVQNDVHLLPNPLMPAEVRWWHFIETASSNFLFAGCAATLVERVYRGVRPPATLADGHAGTPPVESASA